MTESPLPICRQCQTLDLERLQKEEARLREEVAHLREKLQALELQVMRDPLTGLYNKRHFDRVLETEMERARRTQQPLSIILLDLDHFKSVNDCFGHPVGDHVLHAAAQLLKGELRMTDVPCRYGGEEFVVILPSTPPTTAVQVAERLRSALKRAPITTDKGPVRLTASLGVAAFRPDQKMTAASLIERADEKLYEAKRSGRDRVFADTLDTSATTIAVEEHAALLDPSVA
jgi:diguanylate cyclase (GGDEF) domain